MDEVTHLCSSCGGGLVIDDVAKIYKCPYCGVTYDYDFWGDDDAFSRGMTALRRGEFGTARDAFDIVLAKDPKHFLALRGRLLAKAGFKSITDMENFKLLASRKYEDIHVEEELGSAATNDRAYFNRMKNALGHCSEYAEKKKELRDTRSRKTRIEQGLEDIEIASSTPVTTSTDWIIRYGIPTPFIGFAIAIIFMLADGGDTEDDPGKVMALLITLGICVAIAISVPIIHSLMTKQKEGLSLASTEGQIEEQKQRTLFVIGTKIEQLTKEIDALEAQIRKDYLAIREDDPETRYGWKMDQLT